MGDMSYALQADGQASLWTGSARLLQNHSQTGTFYIQVHYFYPDEENILIIKN